MALLDSMVAYYKCDEAANTDLADAHTNSKNLTKNSSPGSTSGHHANVGNARTYDGTDDYHEIASEALFQVSGDQSFWISCWVKFDTLGAFQWFVSKDDASSNREYGVYYDNSAGRIAFYIRDAANNHIQVNWSSGPSTGTWYHVLAWYDNTSSPTKVWLRVDNGTAVSASNNIAAGTNGNDDAAFVVGGYAFHSFLLDGTLNEVAFGKGYVPDSTDADFLWNSGNGVTYEDFGASELLIVCPVFEDATDTECHLSRSNATGGTPPYTYQWQRSDDGADGTWADLAGETGASLTDDDAGLVAGTTYWWRVEVTDNAATVAYSPPVPGRLWLAPMAIGFIGDSLTAATLAPTEMVARLNEQLECVVTEESNEAAGGLRSENWIPGAAGDLLADAITQFTSDGCTHVHYMIGNNDATHSGDPPTTPGDFQDNLQDTCDELVSEGFKVILSGPSFNALLQPGNEHAQALVDYLVVIPNVCDGVNVFLGDLEAVYYFARHQDLLSDGEHMTSTGQEHLGRLWANAFSRSLLQEGGGAGETVFSVVGCAFIKGVE